MTFAIAFPAIDPVLFELGPLVIRWYALAYIAGLIIGVRLMRRLATWGFHATPAERIDDFMVWAVIGVIVGGRLGYILFYNFSFYASHPLAIFQVWKGGMSFHGGLLGVVAASVLYARRIGMPLLRFADVVAVAAPVGLFFGRIANFINGELYGRVTDVPWGVVFPAGGPAPRHPSQLYEAALEGAVLFIILILLYRREGVRQRPGMSAGVFFVGYGLARSFVEFFRQPDAHIGFLSFGTTTGQWLSIPMIAVGLWLIFNARKEA